MTHYNELTSDEYPLNVIQFCETKLSTAKDEERSPFLTSFYCEFNLTKVRDLVKKDEANNLDTIKQLVQQSISLLDGLATKYDTIRVNYWNYLISKWKQEFTRFL